MNRQRIHSFFIIFTAIIFFIPLFAIPTSATTIAIMDWHLVDSGKHLDWGGSTYYQTIFESSVDVWNNYKSGVIREDTASILQDVTIRDFENRDSAEIGITWQGGIIEFNLALMVDLTPEEIKHTMIHELGHALGLDHNQEGDIMYAKLTSSTSLSSNDKASYDKSYDRY